jgi:hypothetical protein
MTPEGCFDGLSGLFEDEDRIGERGTNPRRGMGDHSASKEGNCIPRRTAPGSTDMAPSLFDIKLVEPHLASAIQER